MDGYVVGAGGNLKNNKPKQMKTPEEVKEWFDDGLIRAVNKAYEHGVTPETVAEWLKQHAKDTVDAHKFVVVNKLGKENPPNTHINN